MNVTVFIAHYHSETSNSLDVRVIRKQVRFRLMKVSLKSSANEFQADGPV